MGEPYLKHITDDIWELRPKKVRIFLSHLGDDKFILLSYYIKNAKRTPLKEIIKAKKLLKSVKRGD